jgi:hypothetical protein
MLKKASSWLCTTIGALQCTSGRKGIVLSSREPAGALQGGLQATRFGDDHSPLNEATSGGRQPSAQAPITTSRWPVKLTGLGGAWAGRSGAEGGSVPVKLVVGPQGVG